MILKDGRKIENVKTSLRENHVLVEDETGKVEKIDLTLVEKILISEIEKPEVEDKKKNIKFKKILSFLESIKLGFQSNGKDKL